MVGWGPIETSGTVVDYVVATRNAVIDGGFRSLFGLRGCSIGSLLDLSDPAPRPTRGVLVDPVGISATDRLEVVGALPQLLGESPGVPVVGLVDCPIGDVAMLRLVEAGVTHLIGMRQLGCDPRFLDAFLQEPTIAPRLPTRWELRQSLGMRWDGDIAAFDEAIAGFPDSVWGPDVKQSRLPISRRQIRLLRAKCLDLAGVPPPDFSKFSTDFRNPPEAPEWGTVRDFVRAYRGLDLEGDTFELAVC